MSTISKSHIINQRSEDDLRQLLPFTHFIKHQLIPDYHKDFLIELNLGNEPSGIFFYVQLKGVENVHITKNSVKFSLKTKHLNYYYDKIKDYPVFLLITDTSKNKTYWLFIQKYLKESISNSKWRNQKTVTLSITKENLISDLEFFQSVVKEANAYMKELWPSSPEAATKKEIEFLESLDSRFKVQTVTIADNSINYDFQTVEDIKIELVLKDENDISAFLNDPLKENLKFKTQNIDINGSDLFKTLLGKTENIILKINKPTLDVDIVFSRRDRSLKEIERVFLTGKLSYNNKLFEINSSLYDSPLSIKFIFDPSSNTKPFFDFNFEFTKWKNKPVALLPYANKLKKLFFEHSNEDSLTYAVELKGNPFVSGIVQLWDKKDFTDYLNSIFNFYSAIHLIDTHYKLNLLFPDLEKMQKSAWNDIDELSSLLLHKEYHVQNRTLTINFNVRKDRTLLNPFIKNSAIRIVTGFKFNILGKEVKIDKMAVEINNPKFLLSELEFEELLNSDLEFIPLGFKADKDSTIIYRLLDEEIKIVEESVK